MMASKLSKPGAGAHCFRHVTPFNLPLVSIIWTSCFLICAHDLPILRTSATDLSTDVSALLAFKGNLTQINYWLRSTWNDPATVCTSWQGVACNGVPPRVVNLSLPGKALTGSIHPSTIGNLDALQVLSLARNRLSGPVPPDLSNCKSLLILALPQNRFSGPFSFDFSAWPQLRLLNLSFNGLHGSIPASISGLRSITTIIALQNNSLSGRIPDFPGTPRIFNVANNPGLQGRIPESLRNQSPSYFSGNPNLCGPPLAVLCPGDPSPSPSSSSPSSSSSSPSGGGVDDDKLKLDEGVIVGISIAGVLVLLLICSFILCSKRKAQSTPNTPPPPPPETGATQNTATSAVAVSEKPDLVFLAQPGHHTAAAITFSLHQLLDSSAEVLNKGSFGMSYKAFINNREDGVVVVVKRFKQPVALDDAPDEFVRKVEELGSVPSHPHLLPIRAYLASRDDNLIIFDFLPNRSLAHLLFHENAIDPPMEWEKRLSVAGMVAEGLAHLHKHKVVHGNVKSSNVLMDRNGNPLVADYGFAQLAFVDLSTNMNMMRYMAPEVNDLRRAQPSADVYSFGVLLLELISGKSSTNVDGRNNIGTNSGDLHLPHWVQKVDEDQWPIEVLDSNIMKSEYIQDQMEQLLKIALACFALNPDVRPTMHELVTQIYNINFSESVNNLTPILFKYPYIN